jgi:hypothetical protein
MIATIIIVLFFVCLAGFFGSVMDSIKDFRTLEKFWLWRWVKNTRYMDWYYGGYSLPYFNDKGYKYNPGKVWLSDAWHMAKHLMILSWTGAIAFVFNLEIYYIMSIWIFLYWLEGFVFRMKYEPLKS